uniref:Uncharacterized protein n=1 Tax=Acrobeloides nanus TaxID=290746 RepID=A0A914DH50_9BILA
MAEALADRLAHIEELLGINASDSKLPNLDISSLRKKLQNLKNQDGIKTDFIMKIPRDKLQRLNKGIRQPDLITMKEKLIAIDFARELMLKRSELLEELKRLSEVAFKSDDFSKIPEFESTLTQAEKELSEALADAVKNT